MKRVKIEFSKLIGNHYPLHIKMAVLDWMLKTGKPYKYAYGWNVDGINKALFAYSANNYDCQCRLPDGCFIWHFDSIFARAVFGPENNPLKEWRQKESIFPNKYRMLEFADGLPNTYLFEDLHTLIWRIQMLDGQLLKKSAHHPDYTDRTEPKIISAWIYTTGSGWVVRYSFSFKEFNYEPGWENSWQQNENESVWEFIKRSYDALTAIVENTTEG